MRTYHKDGTCPQDGQIFVFGSNLAGVHGAGAARVAHKMYGANWGQGVGWAGQSYAIPTKDNNIETLSLFKISEYVATFIKIAKSYPDKKFWVTRVGCGLAGYADAGITPMFEDAPDNCSFAEEWRPYLD